MADCSTPGRSSDLLVSCPVVISVEVCRIASLLQKPAGWRRIAALEHIRLFAIKQRSPTKTETKKISTLAVEQMLFIVMKNSRGELIMKLNLLFILMGLLTLLAYPFVFVHGKIHRFSKLRENATPANVLLSGSLIPGG